MLQARREELTHAQHGLDRLQRIRETLTQTPDTTHADRQAIAQARARLDELDLPAKQQVLDLLSVQAQVTGYHPCPTIPPDYDRHWPPSCPCCHRLRVLPEVTVHIGAPELLVPHIPTQTRSRAVWSPSLQSAG
jgi:hypothetical protein